MDLEAQIARFRAAGWSDTEVDDYLKNLKQYRDTEPPKPAAWYEDHSKLSVAVDPQEFEAKDDDEAIEIGGKKVVFRELSIREIGRLCVKLKYWCSVMTWDVDDLAKMRIDLMLFELLDRALADFDMDKNQFGPFARSIFAELALLLSSKKVKFTADFLMDYMTLSLGRKVIRRLVKTNSDFFVSIWNGEASSVKNLISFLTGKITSRSSEISVILDKLLDWLSVKFLRRMPTDFLGSTSATGLNTSLTPSTSDGDTNGILNPLESIEYSGSLTDLLVSTSFPDMDTTKLNETGTTEPDEQLPLSLSTQLQTVHA